MNIRADGVRIDDRIRGYVRERIGRKLGKFALHIERATVRFEDVNGPKGGVDTTCRVKVVLSGLPSILVEVTAVSPVEAFDRAADATERAVRRALGRSGTATPKRGVRSKQRSSSNAGASRGEAPSEGSLIGRRVGGGRVNLERAAERPEKIRRDAPVDTAAKTKSASDRKVGAGATAKRNTKLDEGGMSAALEDSAQDRPSRKSTRRSAGRSKRDSNLKRRETRRVTSPKARAQRATNK